MGFLEDSRSLGGFLWKQRMVLLSASIFVFLMFSIVLSIDINLLLLNAAEKGDAGQIAELLARGATMSVRSNQGVSPTIWAANNGHLEALQTLVEAGAGLEDRSNDGRTSLLWASLWGHSEVVRYLLSRGADVNVADRQGMTPLMHAVMRGHVEVVRALLAQPGLNFTAKNEFGASGYSIARELGHPEIFRLLDDHLQLLAKDDAEIASERLDLARVSMLDILVHRATVHFRQLWQRLATGRVQSLLWRRPEL